MIAFLILAHADPVHLKRLVGRLEPHDVFVHLDAKTRITSDWTDMDATFIDQRLPVHWAGFSQVQATLALLHAAFASNPNYTRYVLLSGSCYPLRPMAELEALFDSETTTNFIKFIPVSKSKHLSALIDHHFYRDAIGSWRLNSKFRILGLLEKVVRRTVEGLMRPIRRKRISGWEPYYGSQWWSITGEAAGHILSFVSTDEGKRLASYYSRSFASDEQFFHTIIGNSVSARASTGLQDYAGPETHRMANLHLIDPSLAKWFQLSDWPAIASSPMFFIRKVRTISSTSLLDKLDECRS